VLGLGLGLGLVSGSSLVGVCRHLAAVASSTYTTVVSIVDVEYTRRVRSVRHDGRVCNISLLYLSLPSVILSDCSTDSPVQDLMSIQAVRGLSRFNSHMPYASDSL